MSIKIPLRVKPKFRPVSAIESGLVSFVARLTFAVDTFSYALYAQVLIKLTAEDHLCHDRLTNSLIYNQQKQYLSVYFIALGERYGA